MPAGRISFFMGVAAVWAIGCGAAPIAVGRPWDPREAGLFDDGVDLVKELDSLSGQWAYEQEKALDGRAGNADLIALVEILSIQTSSEQEQEIGKRIQVGVVDPLYGEAPERKLFLATRKEAPGYGLVLRHESRLSGRFILFLRRFDDGTGKPGSHFHLSPASERMLDGVKQRVQKRERAEALIKLEK